MPYMFLDHLPIILCSFSYRQDLGSLILTWSTLHLDKIWLEVVEAYSESFSKFDLYPIGFRPTKNSPEW